MARTISSSDRWEAIGPSKRRAELALAKRRTEIKEGKFFDKAPAGWAMPYAELIERYLEAEEARLVIVEERVE